MEEQTVERCECTVIHEEVLQRVRSRMPVFEPIARVADLFKVCGDTTRARILCALNLEEMCVCDLSALLSMQQSAISHQLRILKDARLVKGRKVGRVVYYSLDDDHIGGLFSLAFTHVTEETGREGEKR